MVDHAKNEHSSTLNLERAAEGQARIGGYLPTQNVEDAHRRPRNVLRGFREARPNPLSDCWGEPSAARVRLPSLREHFFRIETAPPIFHRRLHSQTLAERVFVLADAMGVEVAAPCEIVSAGSATVRRDGGELAVY